MCFGFYLSGRTVNYGLLFETNHKYWYGMHEDQIKGTVYVLSFCVNKIFAIVVVAVVVVVVVVYFICSVFCYPIVFVLCC